MAQRVAVAVAQAPAVGLTLEMRDGGVLPNCQTIGKMLADCVHSWRANIVRKNIVPVPCRNHSISIQLSKSNTPVGNRSLCDQRLKERLKLS